MNNLSTLPELEALSKQDLIGMVKEYIRYNEMTTHEQYNSKIYKLLSDINEKYNSNETIHQVAELLQIETGRRALTKQLGLQS